MTSNQSIVPRMIRALEERSSSHNNQGSISRSLKSNQEKEDVDIYNSTPFPTKPEQILLPNPGNAQRQIVSDVGFSYSETSRSSSTLWPSPSLSHECSSREGSSSLREHSVGDLWDVSSTIDTGNSPPQMWEEDPNSSNSSLQASSSKGVDYSSEVEYSDEDVAVLPTATPTIKAVVSEPISPKSDDEENSTIGYSSPNVSLIGIPSSPNFVTLDNSSMASLAEPRANSLSSYNSHGTVVRHHGAEPWIYTASSSSGSPSTQSGSQPSGASSRSISRYASADRSHSESSSTPSYRSGSEVPSFTENEILATHSRVRNLSSNSGAYSSNYSERDFTPGPASGRWNPHLSTVPSVYFSESSKSQNTLQPAAAVNADASKSSLWIVRDLHEHRDSLPSLPISHKFSNSLSSSSKRSNSLQSNSTRRPSTASNNVLQLVPTWAKIYYCGNAKGINSAMSWIESRPSTARSGMSHTNVFNLMPTPLNISRTRSPERPQSPNSSLVIQIPRAPERVRYSQQRVESDPRDPRAHWVEDPESADSIVIGSPMRRLRHSWSPHLYTDKGRMKQSASAWTTPSFDSTTEPIFGRRNVQVYSFCLGFIFPLAWMIAAFLPLPQQPQKMEMEEGDDVEMALQSQLLILHQRRYKNARWWRNLNRWMVSLGVVIIVVIVTLAVMSSTTGF